MRFFEILLEYKRDVTLRQFGKKMFNQWEKELSKDTTKHPLTPEEQDQFINSFLQSIEREDPTPNKQYVPWLAREYSKGNIRQLEDIGSRFKPALERFHKAKNTRAFQDYLINAELSQANDISRIDARTFLDIMKDFRDPRERLTDKGESKTVYEDDDVTVIVPLDQAAACYYGQDTDWCTAEREGRNYFDYYNAKGKLYIIIPKNPQTPNEKYQLHMESAQLMDKDDQPAPISVLRRFPGFIEYAKKNIKDFSYFVEFEDPKILKEIHLAAVGLIEDQVRAKIEKWALEDDDYMDLLREKAPTAAGGIDWDKVDRTRQLQYQTYDKDSYDLLRKIDNLYSWTSQQILRELLAKREDWADWRAYELVYDDILQRMLDNSRDIWIRPKSDSPNSNLPGVYLRSAATEKFIGPYAVGSWFTG